VQIVLLIQVLRQCPPGIVPRTGVVELAPNLLRPSSSGMGKQCEVWIGLPRLDLLRSSGNLGSHGNEPNFRMVPNHYIEHPMCGVGSHWVSTIPSHNRKIAICIAKYDILRPWRNWIAHRSSEPRVAGSNPAGRAERKALTLRRKCLFLLALRRRSST
jgi:hypothetical protein